MSSVLEHPPPAGAARAPSIRAPVGTLRALLERDGLTVVALALSLVALAASLPSLLIQDSWLSLVDGRLIAAHWLPHVDTLTRWTLGRNWIDQQWGAHLLLYEVMAHGGVRALVVFGVACVAGALAVVAVASRTLGGSPAKTALAVVLPVLAAPWLAEIRSQSLALPLFVAVYALLAHDARRPSNRVLCVLPLLALWANVHGSVALAAGLALVHGLSRLRRRAGRGASLLLVAGAPLCVVASPYGLRLVGYYRLMLLHPPLASFVSEWRPAYVSHSTAAFFASAFALVALLGASRRALTGFEQWALLLLLVGALTAVRNAIWFELAAGVALPRLLDALRPVRLAPPPQIRRANLLLGAAAPVLALLVCGVQLARPAAWLRHGVPAAAAAAVARAAGPHGIVLADQAHADWLLWQEPSLARRIAYDVRFELFDTGELRQVALLGDGSSSAWRRCGSVARVVTFDGGADARAVRREHVLEPGTRTIVNTPAFVAVVQPAPAPAGRCRL